MEIIIQIKGRVFALCFGRHTKWFDSVFWFSLEEQWLQNREVVYAKLLKTWGR